MFFLRLAFAITLAILATSDANAQLFRFRQRALRTQQPQQIPQTPSRFNPNTYQYTQVPRPQTNVPSTRYTAQLQTNVPRSATQPQIAAQYTQVPRPQTNVPSTRYIAQPQANVTRSVPQPQIAAQTAAPVQVNPAQASNQRVVMLTLRDPNTGRLFQRPYLMTTPQSAVQQPVLQAPTAATQPQVATLPMKRVDNNQATSSVVVQPPSNTSPRSVAQTTFESPILDPVTPEAKEEFSILDGPTQSPILESKAAPELQASVPTAEVVITSPSLDEPKPTQAVAAEPTLVDPVVAEPKLELKLDDSSSVDPGARTRALPLDSAGELDLDIEFAPLNSQN